MRTLSLIASALLAVNAANIPFTSCGTNADLISIKSIDITPALKAGATVTITATGTSSAAIADGSYSLEADYLGIPLTTLTGDICAADAPVKIACPQPAGTQTLSGKFTIPAEAPTGDYTINIKASNKAGAELLCLNIDFTLAGTSKSEVAYYLR